MSETTSSPPGHILVVDDDEDVLKAAALLLRRQGFKISLARNPAEAWSALAADPADVILLDLNFSRAATSGEEGFRWLTAMMAHDPDAVVVVVTGHSGVNIAVAAMRAGASDFVMKPWRNDRLVATLEGALELRRRRRAQSGGIGRHGVPEGGDALPLLLGESPATQRLQALIRRVAPTEASVLIVGEAGTGKSLIARHIHHLSPRSGGPFVAVDLEGLDGEELRDRLQVAQTEAHGGTLCLEEVGHLSRGAQAQVLAMLETVGSTRVLATTRRRREALKGPGGLRDDLLYRLNTIEIATPKLSERGDDALILANHFLRLFTARYGRPAKLLSPDAARRIVDLTWPGDIRELRQTMERCVIFAEGAVYEVADVTPGLGLETPEETPGLAATSGFNLARSERALIAHALATNAFNVSHTARQLGLTRAALYRRMAKHGL